MNVDDIFVAALDIANAADRAAFLGRACAGDEALRRDVDSLLAAHERIGEFLQRRPTLLARASAAQGVPPSGLAAQPTEAGTRNLEKAGDRIGRYKLLEQIGEGGMGTVWMAEQEEPVRRRVALKIIKLGMDTRSVIARFEAERQALALMDHPNIAKVFDGGATGCPLPSDRSGVGGEGTAESEIANPKSQIHPGRPYFVMELVRGLPITKYCEETKMVPRERLDLFGQVCRAVQHAHQKGIIHRDLKPSNILVTEQEGRPVPKVIDFGIAKATEGRLTDKTLFTGFDQLMGTPAYMSPEQAGLGGLDIDTRSDTYSLGVVLYELLTGRPPFDTKELLKQGYDALLRTIREVDPPKPSTRLRQDRLARLQGQSKSEIRNPKSEIDPDLDWIVMKCLEKDRNRRYDTPNGLATDLERYLNEEPVLARPPSALYRWRKFARKHRNGVAAAAGFVLLLTAATAMSTSLALWANRERRGAELAFKVSRESEADTRAFSDFLVIDVLATASPKGRQGGLGIDVTVSNALAAAESKIEKSFKGRPRAEATARHAIGVTWRNLGRYEAAETHLRRALEIREREYGAASREAWEARNSYGVLLSERARYAEATDLLERNVEIWRSAPPTNSPASIASAVSGMINLASVYRHLAREADSFKLLQEAVDLATARLGAEDSATWKARSYLASAQYSAGRYEKAAVFYEEELARLTNRRGTNDIETLTSMNQLGLAYLHCDRLEEALLLLTNAFQHIPSKLGPAHPETMILRQNVAKAYERVGRIREAIALTEENLKLRKDHLGSRHPRTTESLLSLAGLYSTSERLPDALPLFQQAYDSRATLHGPDHLATLHVLHLRGMAHARAGEYANAIPLFETILRRMRVTLGTNSTETVSAMHTLAMTYAKSGRLEDALPLHQEAAQITTNLFGSGRAGSLPSFHALALGWRDAGQLDIAIGLMRQTLGTQEANMGAGHPSLLEPLSDLGQMLAQKRAFGEAESLLLKAYYGFKQGALARPSKARAQSVDKTVQRLVQLYEAWGNADQAADWREKLR